MRAAQVERPAELEEVVGQKRLADRVTGILSRIEEELDHVDTRIGESMHVLDADNDGLVPPARPVGAQAGGWRRLLGAPLTALGQGA